MLRCGLAVNNKAEFGHWSNPVHYKGRYWIQNMKQKSNKVFAQVALVIFKSQFKKERWKIISDQ